MTARPLSRNVPPNFTFGHGPPVRHYRVRETYERFGWRRLWKWGADAVSDDLPCSTVIANGLTRKRCQRELRHLWMEHVRFVTEDDASTIVCQYVEPASPNPDPQVREGEDG